MNNYIAMLLVLLAGCSKPPQETETILVCSGTKSSIIAGVGGESKTNFLIYKIGDGVVRVKTEHSEFTKEKKDVRTPNHKGPVYIQLLVEPDKLILRTEVTEDKRTSDVEIHNTGKYIANYALSMEQGQCTTQNKAF